MRLHGAAIEVVVAHARDHRDESTNQSLPIFVVVIVVVVVVIPPPSLPNKPSSLGRLRG